MRQLRIILRLIIHPHSSWIALTSSLEAVVMIANVRTHSSVSGRFQFSQMLRGRMTRSSWQWRRAAWAWGVASKSGNIERQPQQLSGPKKKSPPNLRTGGSSGGSYGGRREPRGRCLLTRDKSSIDFVIAWTTATSHVGALDLRQICRDAAAWFGGESLAVVATLIHPAFVKRCCGALSPSVRPEDGLPASTCKAV